MQLLSKNHTISVGLSLIMGFNWLMLLLALSRPIQVLAGSEQNNSAAKPAERGQPSPVQTQTLKTPFAFVLADGTPVKLRLTRTISSAEAKVNDRVDFEVLEEIKVGEAVIIERRASAWGTVIETQPKRRMGRGGKLTVQIEAVRLASGEKAALRAVKEVKGESKVGAMTGAMIGAGVLFFPAAPLILLVQGKDSTIWRGAEVTAYIHGDIALDSAKFAVTLPVSAQPPVTQAGRLTAVIEYSTVIIQSTPNSADIKINEKFMGSTPSTLRLTSGEHTIIIEKSGFKLWQRTITATPGGSITVEATLEQASFR